MNRVRQHFLALPLHPSLRGERVGVRGRGVPLTRPSATLSPHGGERDDSIFFGARKFWRTRMNQKEFTRNLRQRSTDAERLLWYRLRDRRLGGFKFRRQHPIGIYTVDFVCIENHLIIELDGGQHYTRGRRHDQQRDEWLKREGYEVLRFPDNVLMKDLNSVLEVVWRHLHRGEEPVGQRAVSAVRLSPSPGLRPPSPPLGERDSSSPSPARRERDGVRD
jgi:very-short-patch-repair endonuclease